MRIFGSKFAQRSAEAARAAREKNRYEAAIPVSSTRPYVPGFVRDARFDANGATRWELSRKARYERRNNWLLSTLQTADVKYTVGPSGHIVIPHSGDADWNQYAAEAYADWCEMPFIDSGLPMFQGHQLSRKEMHIDGEVFENCTYIKLPGQPAQPAIELVESHRVSSPGQEYDYPIEGKDIVDGAQLQRDSNGQLIGRPSGYHVRLGVEGEQWQFRRAFDPRNPGFGGLIHIADPDRIGMARVVSEYAPVLNEISDLFLLMLLEMDRAKANSSYAGFVETWNGELPAGIQGRWGGSIPPNSLPVPGGETDEQMRKRINEAAKTIQAKISALKPGEKVSWVDNQSPSAATQWLWKFVIERVCITRGVPMIFVLPDSMQGTVARGVLEDAQVGFTMQFNIMARAARMKYRFFMNWARYNNPKLADAPADWMKCTVVPPPQVNVDFGRNMNAMLAGIDAGVYDYDDIISKDGSTAEARFMRKARNIGKAKQIAAKVSAEMGVEIKPEEIIGNLAEISALLSKSNAKQNADTETQPAGKGDEE